RAQRRFSACDVTAGAGDVVPPDRARLSTAFHNYGDVSAADASRLATLLVGRILPVCSLLAPCDPGASAPEYVTVIVERSTEAFALDRGAARVVLVDARRSATLAADRRSLKRRTPTRVSLTWSPSISARDALVRSSREASASTLPSRSTASPSAQPAPGA